VTTEQALSLCQAIRPSPIAPVVYGRSAEFAAGSAWHVQKLGIVAVRPLTIAGKMPAFPGYLPRRKEFAMLVVTRKVEEKIEIGGMITITVLRIKGGHAVKIGIDAPPGIHVVRRELIEAVESPETAHALAAV
jgi:carbon storage regulator